MRRAVRLFPVVTLAFAVSAPAAERLVPGKLPTGEMLLPNGRLLTPTGTQTEVAPYPFALALTPDGRRVVVACMGADDQSLHLLDAATGKTLAKEPVKKSWLGLAVAPDGKRVYVAGAGGKNVLVYRLESDRFVVEEPIALRAVGEPAGLDATPSGLAVSTDGKSLWAARMLLNDVVKIDLASRAVAAPVPVGVHPYRPVLSPDGRLLAVSNWGAASVSLVDSSSGSVLATVKTADHPSDLVFSPDGKTLFVAQSNRNLVAAVDVASRTVVRQISVALGPDGPGTPSADALPDGSTPNALALAPDGKTLFVANADDDAVAVVDVAGDVRSLRTKGFVPSGWYPAALALSADGKTLWVANAKGGSSWSNAVGGPDPTKKADGNAWKKTRTIPGSVSRVDIPSAETLRAYTTRAYANRRPGARGAAPVKASAVVPAVPGGVSPIKHVVYVVRENRTYDQVLGDLPQGNGDPSLAIFGRDVTPNAHALAEEFVLLDNFYCDAEVSADGHNWSMGAYATDFVEKIWPPDYGSKGFDYLFEGNDANAFPTNGYLWDAAARAGLTLRNYGEFVGVAAETEPTKLSLSTGMEGALKGNTCPFYPGFDLDILDNARVDVFLKEFRGFVKTKADAASHDRAARQRPHGGDEEGGTHAARDGRRERRRARPARRGDLPLALLEGDRDLRDRGRRPERLGPRGRASDGGPRDFAVHPPRRFRGFDDVLHGVDAQDHGADPRSATDVAARCVGDADDERLRRRSGPHGVRASRDENSVLRDEPRRRAPPGSRRHMGLHEGRTRPRTSRSTRRSGKA